MKNKVKKKQAHLKSKRQKALKRKRNAKPYRPKNSGITPEFLRNIKELEHNLAVENMAEVSFSYLEKGTNYYFSSDEASETAEEFVQNKCLSAQLSSGVRGVIKEGKLEVSKPLTWIPEADEPTVKDYLAELWNKEIEGWQINSFSFYVYDSEEIGEEDSEEEDQPFLCACVIVSGSSREKIQGYLVLREVSYEENLVKINEPNIFLEVEDVLDLHIPPMVDMKKIFEEAEVDSEETGQEE